MCILLQVLVLNNLVQIQYLVLNLGFLLTLPFLPISYHLYKLIYIYIDNINICNFKLNHDLFMYIPYSCSSHIFTVLSIEHEAKTWPNSG